MKTTTFNPGKVNKHWLFLDAQGMVLGRLATHIAKALMGKTQAIYAPNMDLGSKVVVTNASKIVVTGKKLNDKIYHRYTGFPGGLRSEVLGDLLQRRPEEVIRKAVKGMLPKNRLQKVFMSNLYVYGGNEHPHKPQNSVNK